MYHLKLFIYACVCVGVFVSVIIIYSLPMGGAALKIAGGSNCSQKQIWQVAKAAGMGQCNPGRLPMFNQSSLSVYHREICIVLELGTTNPWRHQWICSFKTWGEPGVDCCTLR